MDGGAATRAIVDAKACTRSHASNRARAHNRALVRSRTHSLAEAVESTVARTIPIVGTEVWDRNREINEDRKTFKI